MHDPIEAGHVRIGCVLPMHAKDSATTIPAAEVAVAAGNPVGVQEELHDRRVAYTREHQLTMLLWRQRANVERLPVTGKPLTETKASTPIKDTQQ